ncbi:LuxR C-terminal-related transcriptional regulator [Streptomyces sp. ADMS]|nr:LuxR C-terminal-related transcriptional regulator [Streptomyces sp. ADMS]MDW4905776.1 LuxR C-terminal-related transcriptional regulator [Streptomyces sp. ADMS]
MILISGEEGFGKTRLVHEVSRIAEEREFTLVRADDGTLPPRADDRPTLTVLDDLHTQTDQALLRRLTADLASLRHCPHLWLLTLRDQAYGLDVHRFVRALDDWGCTRLTLGRLSPDSVQELFTDILGAVPDAGLTALADEAGGHPLLATALATGLREDGLVRVVSRQAALTSTVVPTRLRSTVNCLLSEQGEQVQDVLRTAAVLGPEFCLGELSAILVDLPAVALAALVQRAVDAGLLDCHDNGRLTFRNELLHRTLVDSTAPSVRQVLLDAASGPGTPAAVPGPPREESAAILSARAISYLDEGRTEEAREAATALFHNRAAVEDASGQGFALVVRSTCARLDGQPTEALRLSREAAAIIPPGKSDFLDELVTIGVALELSLLGEPDEAERLLRKAHCWTYPDDTPPSGLALATVAARLLSLKGDHQRADRWIESAMGVLRKPDGALLPLATTIQALAALRGGDLRGGDLCDAEILMARRQDESLSSHRVFSAQPEWVALQIAAERHGAPWAVELLGRRYADLVTGPLLFTEEPGAAPWLVRTALAAHAPRLAEQVVCTVRNLARDNADYAPLSVSALHAAGLLHHDEGALTRARREHRCPWAAAGAAEDLGILLLGRGTGEGTAVRQFTAARRLYEEAGALRDASRIAARFNLPTTRASAPPESRPVVPEQELTHSERAVAELVVLGMTNRQVAGKLHLSSYTVNYHLRNIFRKFGIKSRVELARCYQDGTSATELPVVRVGSRPEPASRPSARPA